MELSRDHIRAIIFYEYSQKTRAVDCHRKICSVLGSDLASLHTVEIWYRKFRSGVRNLEDDPIPGRPTVLPDDELRQTIQENGNVTTRQLAVRFDVSHPTIVLALKRLNLTYKFNRWVPHTLTDKNKADRMVACRYLLEEHRRRPFLDRLVTCDEKWIYYDNTGRKGEWSEAGQPASTVARRTLTNKKVLLCIWWDCRGIIYKEYLKCGETIDSDAYSRMLVQVADAIKQKRQNELRRKTVLFHQDNARPHVSSITGWTLHELEWDLMTHPPYSPDLAPSDYYLFSHLQLHLRGEIFKDSEEAKKEVDAFLESRPPEFFKEGIEKLPKRWEKVVALHGDYYPH